MSRCGYDDDCNGWDLIRWRGAVTSAIRGKRGQAFLREMLTALDALQSKELIKDELELRGQVCALGAVAVKRGTDLSDVDSYDRETVATALAIPPSLAAEIMSMNDDWFAREAPADRYTRMRAWVASLIKENAE